MKYKHKTLLLNVSNMETYPVYPYAFIQVPAIARRAGVEVVCKDLLGIPKAGWSNTIQSLISQHDPVMVLITLRNTDSMVVKDYDRDLLAEAGREAYFPIERTRELITTLREITTLKIAVGGFAFSLLAEELMDYLRPDLGVFGAPDDFFNHFEDVLLGRYDAVRNLLYFQGGNLGFNPITFYPPFHGCEYTTGAVQDMLAFYEQFPAPGFQGAPVEVMRGCPHSCVFCAEPHVEGRRVQYRDLSALMGDIKILTENGVQKLYMISSELNPEGNGFLLQLGERIKAFNDSKPEARKVRWFGANYLLNLSAEEYEALYQSGFTGGWFDFTALDDHNARLMRTPYRNESLVHDLRVYVQAEYARAGHEIDRTTDGSCGHDVAGGNGQNPEMHWSMFLGNPETTIPTLRNTIRIAHQQGFDRTFNDCSIIKNMRVFDYEGLDASALELAFSFSPDLERGEYRQLLPSFVYPPALLEHFGTEEQVLAMFKNVAETYLSTKYQRTRDWWRFLRMHTSLGSIKAWEAAFEEQRKETAWVGLDIEIEALFTDTAVSVEDDLHQEISRQLVEKMVKTCLETFPEVYEAIGFPYGDHEVREMTPFELASTVYLRWDTKAEMQNEVKQQSKHVLPEAMRDCIWFCVLAILHRFNVGLLPEYRALFVS